MARDWGLSIMADPGVDLWWLLTYWPIMWSLSLLPRSGFSKLVYHLVTYRGINNLTLLVIFICGLCMLMFVSLNAHPLAHPFKKHAVCLVRVEWKAPSDHPVCHFVNLGLQLLSGWLEVLPSAPHHAIIGTVSNPYTDPGSLARSRIPGYWQLLLGQGPLQDAILQRVGCRCFVVNPYWYRSFP